MCSVSVGPFPLFFGHRRRRLRRLILETGPSSLSLSSLKVLAVGDQPMIEKQKKSNDPLFSDLFLILTGRTLPPVIPCSTAASTCCRISGQAVGARATEGGGHHGLPLFQPREAAGRKEKKKEEEEEKKRKEKKKEKEKEKKNEKKEKEKIKRKREREK